MSVAGKFNNLSAPQKRTVMVATAVVVILFVSWALASVSEKKSNRHPRAEKPEVTVVTPTRATGVEAFSAQLSNLEKAQEDMKKRFEVLSREGLKTAAQTTPAKDPTLPPEDMIPELTAQSSVFEAPVQKGPTLPPPPPAPAMPPAAVTPEPAPSAPAAVDAPAPTAHATGSIRIIAEDGEVSEEKSETKLNTTPTSTKAAKAPESAFVPAGSMFTGVLLSGLDAPTSAVAQKNPTPVVVRVKREAVLPNYASIDVRECFVMAAGYGQLSTERALMRAETLSCVRSDGQVIESSLDAYIVGTDGKVGVPGRLVSKQGQMIAQTLLAGTLGGLGQAFNRSRVPALNLTPESGHTLYESESLGSIGQSGIAGGLGAATNMIAKFYLDMAKETFPVVEIPAGEVITVIVTRGSTLPLKGSTSLQRISTPPEGQRPGLAARKDDHQAPLGNPAATANVVMSPAEAAIKAAVKTTDTVKSVKPTMQNGLGW